MKFKGSGIIKDYKWMQKSTAPSNLNLSITSCQTSNLHHAQLDLLQMPYDYTPYTLTDSTYSYWLRSL